MPSAGHRLAGNTSDTIRDFAAAPLVTTMNATHTQPSATSTTSAPRLIITPGLRVTRLPGGGLATTMKFIEGVREYARTWPGPITALMQPIDHESDNLDEVKLDGLALGFDVGVVDYRSGDLERELRGAAVCLAAASHGQEHIADVCRRAGVACVITTENTLSTRLQMARASDLSTIRRWRHNLWQYNLERRLRRAIRLADAIQCNGTPTFDAYRALNERALLYFDTRVRDSMLASESNIESRGTSGPLRLVFSGRLVSIKGVDHLPEVAAELSRLGVDFTMTICGDGALAPSIRERVAALGLGDRVRLTGVLDFTTELVPFVREKCDLFVCCHRQGDPSCTYLETMSCGVPIAGYDNEAHAGLVRESGCGWAVPMNRPRELATLIAGLAKNRQQVTQHARRALAFAREHTFDRTFARRVEQLLAVVRARASHTL